MAVHGWAAKDDNWLEFLVFYDPVCVCLFFLFFRCDLDKFNRVEKQAPFGGLLPLLKKSTLFDLDPPRRKYQIGSFHSTNPKLCFIPGESFHFIHMSKLKSGFPFNHTIFSIMRTWFPPLWSVWLGSGIYFLPLFDLGRSGNPQPSSSCV